MYRIIAFYYEEDWFQFETSDGRRSGKLTSADFTIYRRVFRQIDYETLKHAIQNPGAWVFIDETPASTLSDKIVYPRPLTMEQPCYRQPSTSTYRRRSAG